MLTITRAAAACARATGPSMRIVVSEYVAIVSGRVGPDQERHLDVRA
jgi:hypothetical protein